MWCGVAITLPLGRLRQEDCQASLGYRMKLPQKTKIMGWTCILAEYLPSIYEARGLIPGLYI